jgi:hypothetical protein
VSSQSFEALVENSGYLERMEVSSRMSFAEDVLTIGVGREARKSCD